VKRTAELRLEVSLAGTSAKRLAASLPPGETPQTNLPRVSRVVFAAGDPFEKTTPASLPSDWNSAADCISAARKGCQKPSRIHFPVSPQASPRSQFRQSFLRFLWRRPSSSCQLRELCRNRAADDSVPAGKSHLLLYRKPCVIRCLQMLRPCDVTKLRC
jgi:hypothetical protein